MEMFAFAQYDPERCCLCGAQGTLTAEHKFKATQIRQNFPESDLLSISNPEWPRPKFIQGAKSNNLKFKKSICAKCNNDRTQAPDRAFDDFHRANSANLKSIMEEHTRVGRDVRPVTSAYEKDVFRYFAKLLCCFIAEIDGPRPRAVGAFAASFFDRNPILLRVTKDSALAEIKQNQIATGWVAHGGLWVRFDNSKRFAEAIGSRLTVGEVRYEYWIELSIAAQWELYLLHGDFLERAKKGIVV